MTEFKKVNSESDINLSEKWVDATKLDSNGQKIVIDKKGKIPNKEYTGHRYRVITKQRAFTAGERFFRGALGVLAVISSLGLGLFSDSVTQLFTEANKNRNYRVLVSDEENNAATTFAKYIRGQKAREPVLDPRLYTQYSTESEKAKSNPDVTPKAKAGNTRVYLPEEMPEVVLKSSGHRDAIKRFHQMQDVRSVLDSQNSSHLIIPKASLRGDFLVEERLPININSYHNILLYHNESALFDAPVREFTRLFSKINISDLTDSRHTPLSIVEGYRIRYDNIPLYIVETDKGKEGRIGLIDLEYMTPQPHPDGLINLARIFPYHIDIIVEEARSLGMQIDEPELRAIAAKSGKFLGSVASYHNWLSDKGVFANEAPQPFEVSSERIEPLTKVVARELLKHNEYRQNFLGDDRINGAVELSKILVPALINAIKNEIQLNNEQINLSPEQMTDIDLIRLRSPPLNRVYIFLDAIAHNEDVTNRGNIPDVSDLFDKLLRAFMEDLIKNKEIFFFDFGEKATGYDECLIRY